MSNALVALLHLGQNVSQRRKRRKDEKKQNQMFKVYQAPVNVWLAERQDPAIAGIRMVNIEKQRYLQSDDRRPWITLLVN